VVQRDDFVMPGKNNFMFTDNGTAPHTMQADFFFPPLLPFRLPVIYRFRGIRQRGGNRVIQHQRRAARGIHFVSVMALKYFNVKIRTQHFCRGFRKLHQQIYSERHVPGTENRDILRRLLNRGKLRGVVTRRTHHKRGLLPFAIVQQAVEGSGSRKINHRVRARCAISRTVKNRVTEY
jgi:hypothetical protein